MGTVLCKLFSYLYTISLSHSSGVANTVFRFVSFRFVSGFLVFWFSGFLIPLPDSLLLYAEVQG